MKNLTLRIDDELLDRARRFASERGTTIAKLIREHLERLTGESDPAEEARRGLLELSDRSVWGLRSGWKWDREEIYAERLSRFKRDHLRGDRPTSGFGEAPAGKDFDRDE